MKIIEPDSFFLWLVDYTKEDSGSLFVYIIKYCEIMVH
jgi:hypothetical protein